MAELTNLRRTVRRHTSPGSVLILMAALFMIGPRLVDEVRGVPWIENDMEIILSDTGRYIVRDEVRSRRPAYGDREMLLEGAGGHGHCVKTWAASWDGVNQRDWDLRDVAGSAGCVLPDTAFRICATFSVRSATSGRHGSFGPFCTGWVTPERDQ